ncbi:hypothetical protein GCM10009118_07470 [Wandonia haliotis]|uniref:Uncharacterized protein n=1 Tax=Wandonia haliotis TaxID=574963 RepID=A0ABN1MMA9_9FLAO
MTINCEIKLMKITEEKITHEPISELLCVASAKLGTISLIKTKENPSAPDSVSNVLMEN